MLGSMAFVGVFLWPLDDSHQLTLLKIVAVPVLGLAYYGGVFLSAILPEKGQVPLLTRAFGLALLVTAFAGIVLIGESDSPTLILSRFGGSFASKFVIFALLLRFLSGRSRHLDHGMGWPENQ